MAKTSRSIRRENHICAGGHRIRDYSYYATDSLMAHNNTSSEYVNIYFLLLRAGRVSPMEFTASTRARLSLAGKWTSPFI